MEGLTLAGILGLIGLSVTIGAAIVKVTRTIFDAAQKAEDKAHAVDKSLSDYKLHVSETYVSKNDMREALEPVMDSIKGVRAAVDTVNNRLDRAIDTQRHATPTRRP